MKFIIIAILVALTACGKSPPIENSIDDRSSSIIPMKKISELDIQLNNKKFLKSKRIFSTLSMNRVRAPKLSGQTAVNWANKNAIDKPILKHFIRSTVKYTYNQGDLYIIYAKPLNVTDIVFQKKEKISFVSSGDTLRWQVVKAYSGSGIGIQEHLLVKPSEPNLQTNLVIITNFRNYHILLRSTQKTYMSTASWYYPRKRKLNRRNDTQYRRKISSNYKLQLLSGNKPSWMPIRVFNDGKKTYIQLPVNRQSSPLLFIGSNVNNDRITNYRCIGDFYIIDQIPNSIQLRLGNKPVTVVQISLGTINDA